MRGHIGLILFLLSIILIIRVLHCLHQSVDLYVQTHTIQKLVMRFGLQHCRQRIYPGMLFCFLRLFVQRCTNIIQLSEHINQCISVSYRIVIKLIINICRFRDQQLIDLIWCCIFELCYNRTSDRNDLPGHGL